MADNVLATPPKKQRERYRPELLKILDDYAARVANDFTSGLDRSAQGFGEMVDDGNYLTGVPRLALGGLQWMGSPVSAAVSPILGPVLQPVGEAVDTYVGQPVERATGYPADITNELFLTGVTAGAGPLLKPALKGTGNFLATMGDAAEAGLNRVGYTARPQAGTFFSGGGPVKLADDVAGSRQGANVSAMAKDRQGYVSQWGDNSRKPVTYRLDEWIGSKPYQRADELAAALNDALPEEGVFSVTKSGSKAGDSAYIRTRFGDIRISDHGHNPGNSPGLAWSDLGRNADSMSPQKFVDWYKASLIRSKERAAEEAAREAAKESARKEATAPMVAEQQANREAKQTFWRNAGLENATQTARDKAWKAYKRSLEAK